MSKASHNTTRPLNNPDAELIKVAVACGAAFGAMTFVGKGDPTGDGDFSERALHAAARRMERALAKLAMIPAQTMAGLSSKARLVSIITGDLESMAANDAQIAFLDAFAADAIRLAGGTVSLVGKGGAK